LTANDPSIEPARSCLDAALRGVIAVVTGASSGIGRAVAIELAAAGADVLVHARSRRAAAEQTAQAVIEQGRRCQVLTADLADQRTHTTLIEAAWDWQGQVDVWINNAGSDVLTGPAVDWSFEEKLQTLWQVDVVATMRLSRMAGARMVAAAPGRKRADLPVILNVGWDQADRGMAGDSGEMFAATKGAVMAFTRSLAKSLAPYVRVNCLAPGWIKTAWGDEAPAYWQQRARRESLLDRWGLPEDVAHMACFLASPAASFITGQVIPINGGNGPHG